MVCVVVTVGLGSLWCSWCAGCVSVVARVDRAISSFGGGWGLSPVCRLACIALAFSICICVCPVAVICFSKRLVQSHTPSSHKGARCFRSRSAYRRG